MSHLNRMEFVMNGLLYLSSSCRNENPFGDIAFTQGTFAVILASALSEMTKKYNVKFAVVPDKSKGRDILYMTRQGKTRNVCLLDGNVSVYKVRQAVEKKRK
jgi:hypothetical protein